MLIEAMFLLIKSDKNKAVVLEARRCLDAGDKAGYDRIKREMEAFTPSADCSGGRNMNCVVGYTQVLCADVDNVGVDRVVALKEKAANCVYTMAVYISPSGRGLKIFVQVDSSAEHHKLAFKRVSEFYSALLEVPVDPSGSDITRLCFEGWDPELYYNEVAVVFHVEVGQPATSKLPLPLPENDIELIFAECVRKVSKSHAFVVGQRNTFVFLLALHMHRYGVEREDTLEMLQREHYCYHLQEVRYTIDSAYKYKLEVPKNPSWRCPENYPSMDDDPQKYDKIEAFINGLIDRRFNVVTNRLEIRDFNSDDDFSEITDYEENSLWVKLKHAGFRISSAMLHGLLNSEFSPRYNPFYDYFSGLAEWDRSTDHIAALAATVLTTDMTFWTQCLRKWITGMVASLLDDDVVNHTVIVFTGPQGIGKTTWLLNLVPPQLKKYQYSGVINPACKDTLIHFTECVHVNMDEMETLSQGEQGALKELITKGNMRFRRPYGHYSDTLIRRASLTGSVNTSQFLNDTSGNRRFICIEVKEIDYMQRVEMDRVFAQALVLYKSGFQYWFDRNEIVQLMAHNEEFVFSPVIDELLLVYFAVVPEGERFLSEQVLAERQIYCLTATEIVARIGEKAHIAINNNAAISLGKALRKHGFVRFKRNSVYVYLVKVMC
jgi:hypothetical protein